MPAHAAADLLNDRVLPFYEEQGIPLCRVLIDRRGVGFYFRNVTEVVLVGTCGPLAHS